MHTSKRRLPTTRSKMMMATFGPCSLGPSSTLGGATGSIGDASGGASNGGGLLLGGALGGKVLDMKRRVGRFLNLKARVGG